ncbi:MAG: hypothetical protein ACR2Q4_07045 [Geminicoccaceae bacterium]
MRLGIVTGADHVYFELMQELLATLRRSALTRDHSLCILDFGLLPAQIAELRHDNLSIVQPGFDLVAADQLTSRAELGYAARPAIPSYFPGYDMYLWLDADISVQNGDFATAFVEAARDGALAIAEEADRSYCVELYALKWQIGNAIRCFGLGQGLTLLRQRPINSGIFALRGDAPLWSHWQRRYQQAVARAGRANLDQHALMAALYLDEMPHHYLDSTYNWICARSRPFWDDRRQVFCRPYAPYDPINVLHLAGRQKQKLWSIQTLDGETREMPLSYAVQTSLAIN